MPSTGSIPLQDVIPGQLISSTLWNSEFSNVNELMIPSGIDTYSSTDSEMQIQTNPYPGSVTSHATSLAGELERIRYQLAGILGTDYWYKPAAIDLTSVSNVVVPLGGIVDYPVVTPPSADWHLADGTAISRTIYSDLFAIIGTTFGIGDGSLTFNLPNYTDRVSIAAGSTYAAGDTGGATSNTPSVIDPGHNHLQNVHTHDLGGHVHSTPNHVHDLDSGTVSYTGTATVHGSAGKIGAEDNGSGFITTYQVTGSSSSQSNTTLKSTTTNSGGSTTGLPSDDSGGTVATNIGNTTGITMPAIPTLPPYLGMYKMIRIL